MDKQEVINKLKAAIPDTALDDYQRVQEMALTYALELVGELDEPEKPILPQFIADWLEVCKENLGFSLSSAMSHSTSVMKAQPNKVQGWFNLKNNQETFAKAWLFGYEVEKEKLYTVEIPIANSPLGYHYALRKTISGEIIIDSFFTNNWGNYDYCQLTEEEIKKDHDWAWKYAKEVK